MSTDRSDSRLDMLADLLAGEGSEQDVDTVADSPELSAALVDLEAAQAAVTADLARLPHPVVPEGLEDRIAAALGKAGAYEPLARVPVAGVRVAGDRGVTGDPGDDTADRDLAGARDLDRARARRRTIRVSHVTGQPPGNVVPLRRKAAPVRNPWPLRAAAAVALVTVGGLAIAALAHGSDSTDRPTTTAAGAASAELPGVPTNNSGTDYAASPGLLEAALPSLLGGAAVAAQRSSGANRLGSAVPEAATKGGDPQGSDTQGGDPQGSDTQGSDTQGSDTQGSDTQGSDTQGSDSQGSGTDGPQDGGKQDFSRSAAPAPVPNAPAPAPSPVAAGSDPAPEASARTPVATPDPTLDRLRKPDELEGCLSALAPPDEKLVPAALDYAAWEGKPALVILVATPPDAVQPGYDAFMVGAGCRAGSDDTLHFERIPA